MQGGGAALGADVILFLTGVECVFAGFGGPSPRPAHRERGATALDAGEFPRGSVGPKVEAATRFVEGGSGHAMITSLDRVASAPNGRARTHIVRDP